MAANPKEPSEVDRLLAEVDGMLGDGPQALRPAARRRPSRPPGRWSAGCGRPLMAGAVAGVGVWVLFALLPFLRAGSGGVGAFLATFVAVLLLPRRR